MTWAAVCFAAVLMCGGAEAACAPAAGNNVSALCTGATAGNFGNVGFSNLNVTVDNGASVSGAILFNTGSLTNRGSVAAAGTAALFNSGTVVNDGTMTGSTGIDAGQAIVTNRGTITASGFGVTTAGGNLTLDNSGTLSGFFGVISDAVDIINSGAISGTGSTGIDASVRLTLTNTATGTINGQTAAVTAPVATIRNAGSISSASTAAIDVATLDLVSSGSVSGVTSAVHGTTATIANAGRVVASAGRGIDLTGSLALSNSGFVGGSTNAVRAASATIVNSGTLAGTTGDAISLTGNGDITNSGTIFAGRYGITSFGTIRLSNSGTMFGSSSGLSVNGATIDNSGIIRGNVIGVDVGIATVTNSGTITGQFIGITTNQLTLFNSGTVAVNVAGASAIYALSADITNAGLIAAADTANYALSLGSGPDTLTSLPGSRIIGLIDLAGGADKVNFRGGNFNYTFTSLAGATVSSTTPYLVNGAQVVTFDPTSFGAMNRNLLTFASAVSSSLPIADPPAPEAGAPLGYAAAARPPRDAREAFATVTPQGPSAVYAGGTSLWARGFAGEREQAASGAQLHTVNRFQGGLIGGDWQANPQLRLGVFLGGGAMQTSEDFNLATTSADVVFGGAFARSTFGATFLDITVQLGHFAQRGSRLISNNLLAGGFETALASTTGVYAIPELGLGRRIDLGRTASTFWTLTPAGRVRYLGGTLGGYSESGAAANATIGNRTLSELEERAELQLSAATPIDRSRWLNGSLRAGVIGLQRLGDGTVNMTLLGQSVPFALPGANDVWGAFGGAGLDVAMGPASLFVAGEYLKLSDSSVVYSGRGGLRIAF